jgi:flagellar biogenesis protein FliO
LDYFAVFADSIISQNLGFCCKASSSSTFRPELAVFFGGVWLFRNWQRTVSAKGQMPKLNILETKSLGQRHALYVVGYEQQRLLIAASPAGVTMLTPLPAAVANATEETSKPGFGDVLRQALQRKS